MGGSPSQSRLQAGSHLKLVLTPLVSRAGHRNNGALMGAVKDVPTNTRRHDQLLVIVLDCGQS